MPAGGADTPHLLHVFATFVPGGPQVRTVQLMAALGDAYRHTVIAMDGRTEARRLVPTDVALRVVDPPSAGGGLSMVLALRGLFTRLDPDLVLTYNWGSIEALPAARWLGLPLVHHEDGFSDDEATRFKRRRVLFRRLVLPAAHVVITPSANLERIALETWRQPRERVRHIVNGIRVDDFAPRDGNPELRRRLGVPEEALLVGGVGHLRAEKNYARLLDVIGGLERRPPVHLLLLGNGTERPALEARAARGDLRERAHLVGHQEQLADYYRAMDVFAISSDTEQMPVALLEAMASALPVVSTDVGDVAQVLDPEQRPFVVPLGEHTARKMAEAIERLADDGALRQRLGAANRLRARERYRFEDMLGAYRRAYEAALGERA